MKKIFFTLIACISITAIASAQYVDNALIFSQHYYGSTARSKAMGSAFGALGGDFSSLSINPAGIGIYQRGDVSTTMSAMNLNKTESAYQGNSNQEDNNNFNFKNFGYVSAMPVASNSSGLISFNFGIGYNRLANFNQNTYVSSENSPYSRMDAFAQNTNGINFNDLVTTDTYDPYEEGIPWESKLAWENYLIDVSNPATGGDLYSTFLLENEKVKQAQYTSREGFINEYLGSFGANFNHKFYCGVTFGMQDLFYDEATLYRESGDNTTSGNAGSWGSFDYSNNTRSTGFGYNFKFGAIYRPVQILRIGFALHTPTYFHVRESYNSSMSSNLKGINDDADGTHNEITPIGNFEYDFNSPLRIIGSVAFQFAKKAMLSVDYEFADYSSMKYNNGMDGVSFSADNTDIKTVYKAVNNIRVGAEYKVTNEFSIRGGMEFMGNPYNSTAYGVSQPNADYKFKTYNGGIGYRNGIFSVDITYGLGDKTNYMYMYQVDGVNVDAVKYHSLQHELLFTFGLRM